MVNETGGAERRKAKRINVNLQVKIAKAIPAKGDPWGMEWVDVADLKNISYSGAYFEYRGRKQLSRDDVLRVNLDVSFPFENEDISVSERLPLSGLASIVHTQRNPQGSSLGVGVKFLEPLSMMFNSH
jgi:hypothetical protein